MRTSVVLASMLVGLVSLMGCGGSTAFTEGTNGAGAPGSSGGAASGGSSSGGSGTTGGAASGGASTGGWGTDGGASTGGVANTGGGQTTGGVANTGGSSTGGAATGGNGTGGVPGPICAVNGEGLPYSGCTCDELLQRADKQLEKAQSCSAAAGNNQCTETVSPLGCGCQIPVNPANKAALVDIDLLRAVYEKKSCKTICPLAACLDPTAMSCKSTGATGAGQCVATAGPIAVR